MQMYVVCILLTKKIIQNGAENFPEIVLFNVNICAEWPYFEYKLLLFVCEDTYLLKLSGKGFWINKLAEDVIVMSEMFFANFMIATPLEDWFDAYT